MLLLQSYMPFVAFIILYLRYNPISPAHTSVSPNCHLNCFPPSCRNDSRIEPAPEQSSDSSQSISKTSAKEQEETAKESRTHESHVRMPYEVYKSEVNKESSFLCCLQQDHHSSSHSLHDEHKHRFVHSHRGELAGSFVSLHDNIYHAIASNTYTKAVH